MISKQYGRILCLATTALFLAAPLVTADDDEGDLLRTTKRTWFGIESFETGLELDYNRTVDNNSSPAGNAKSTEDYFQEQLTLHTAGTIYHPNLMTFDVSGGLIFSQDNVNTSGNLASTTSSKSDVTDFTLDASATILRSTPTPIYLFGQRLQSLDNVDFGPSLREIDSTYGGNITFNSQTFPMRLQASHNEQQVIDPAGQQGYTQNEDIVEWQGQYRLAEHQRIAADYSYMTVDEKADLAAPLSFEVQNVSVSHGVGFGDQYKNNLTSFFSYSDQTGAYPEQRINWNESLTFHNSDSLNSYINYNETSDLRPTLDQTTERLEAGFHHKLYESLFTNGAIGWDRLDQTGNDLTNEYYGRLNFDYRKKVPWGELTSNLNLSYSYDTAGAQTQPVPVIDQPVTFTDPAPVVLLNTNVVASSIIVKSSSGVRLYTPNVDYIVVQFPTRTEIHRVLGGAITDDQTVLLDYLLGPQPASDTTTQDLAYGLSYGILQGKLTGLRFYGEISLQSQSIRSAQPQSFTPDNEQDFTIGAEYQRFGIRLNAEQEWRNSTLDSYDSSKFTASYTARITRDSTFTVGGNYQIIDYAMERSSLEYLQANASVKYALTRDFSLQGGIVYRDERDPVLGATRGIEEQLELDFRRRKVSVTAMVRNVNDTVGSNREQYMAFELAIKRQF